MKNAAITVSFALLAVAWPLVGASANGQKVREISRVQYDGVTDDLLTAGIGKSGIQSSAAPGFADFENPTVAELRRLAIYNNYRALVDTTSGGGFGRLYGPNVAADGTVTDGEGLIPGIEIIGVRRKGFGGLNVTMMVQIPDSFNPDQPCIVTAPSSGSRGIYGAIGTAGEWGLKNGCAVAYTDKGTGTGAHDLQNDKVNLISGERANARDAGRESSFTAMLSPRQQAEFNEETPNRFAFKHAHSQANPEKDWGQDLLISIEFAFEMLNRELGQSASTGGKVLPVALTPEKRFRPENTIVIASSVSNGAGSSVRAAEEDKKGLIDGIAVSEPNVNPEPSRRFAIIQGGGAPFSDHSKSLLNYFTLLNVYQGCANAAPGLAAAPLNFAPAPARCASLRGLGLLKADDLAGQAAEAQAIINDYGFLPEQNSLQPSHWFINVPQGIAVTYTNSYGRFRVISNICDYSFAATDPVSNAPIPLSSIAEAQLFATSNGIPPTGGINLVNNAAAGGALLDRASSPDQNLTGALCLRGLATGADPVAGARLSGIGQARHRVIENGIREIRASGNLRGIPAIFVTGRDDAVLPPNHTSRAYFGLNQIVEKGRGNLRYIEVLNAHHLDTLNALANFGFAERWISLHYYFNQALDLMLDHLRNGAPLPPSQVVRTTPRGPGTPPPPALVPANLPPISFAPDAGSLITFDGQAVRIPD
jgi:hydroxybutyrate-dimer hydrolase